MGTELAAAPLATHTVAFEVRDRYGRSYWQEEVLELDPDEGPLVYKPNGKVGTMKGIPNASWGIRDNPFTKTIGRKTWSDMTSTERDMLCIAAAKKNRTMRDWKGEDFWQKGWEERARQQEAKMLAIAKAAEEAEAAAAAKKAEEARKQAEAEALMAFLAAQAAAEEEKKRVKEAAMKELEDELTFF
eukprot:gnl/TRDRNA2_/TRDRNA2_192099_c0_seq1.p1 gnl/TRDRNA2_/TRDRNA2_192099_c0~~gnl/TRDRNA2_/TRDRNA2_192099_c0_seq1.p1  ORF type:complete len:187 (+),score=60.37 gnl/TRDRNA2_/TRDRNA2_192099_c0_seq1:96-656(+)